MLACARSLVRTLTFGRSLTARGFLGRLCQRGLSLSCDPERRTVRLTAYTDRGPTDAAQLEVPVDELRHLARVLLDLAEAADERTRPALRPLSATALAA